MSAPPPHGPGGPVDEPSNRWPWLALGLGLLLIVIALGVFFYNLSQANQPAVPAATSTATRTPTTTATSVPTLTVAPTQTAAPSATAAPTATPAPPSPTPQPQRTPTPAPAVAPQPSPTPAAVAVAPQPTAPAPQPTAPAAQPQPTQAQPTQAPAQATPAPATPTLAQPTPTSGQATPAAPVPPQIAESGGLGNVRADFDATYGAPTGETPGTRLVVYRRDSTEYRVQFAATDPPRASTIVQVPPQAGPLQLNAAQAEARRLLPRDAQPRGSQQAGNQEFVVERYSSATLARALPAEVFRQARGEPGDVVVVYVRNPQGAITRIAIGAGDDADRVRTLAS